MKIINNKLPPNYSEIKAVLNPPEDTVFAFGDTIYNPSGREIDPDIIHHEEVHARQQQNNPNWLARYLYDPKFREECEIEAYGSQLKYLKDKVGVTNKDLKMFLFEMANALSKDYKLDLNYKKAESLIKNYASRSLHT